MGAEEVPLALDEGGGQARRAQLVDVGQRGGQGGGGHAAARGQGHDLAPGRQGLAQGGGEHRGRQETDRRRVGLVGAGDVVQEAGADNAPVPPDAGHGARVHVPAVLGAGGGDEVEALGVGGDLGPVQGPADRGDQGRLLVLRGRGGRRGPGVQVGVAHGGAHGRRRRGGPGEGRLGDGGHGHAQLQGGLRGPRAGALLAGLVDDDVDEGPAGGRVDAPQDLGGDVNEVGVEFAVPPGAEDLGDGGHAQPDGAPQQVVGLGDELHIGVLDAVVDHLDEVAGAVGAHVRAAGFAVDVGGDGLEHGAQPRIGLLGAAGHDRGAQQRPLLPPGHAHAHEVDAAFAQVRLAALGVAVEGVAGVDDNVSGLQQGAQLVDDRLGGGPGLDHDNDRARAAQAGHEVGRPRRGHEVALVAVALHEPARARRGAVEHGHRVPVAGEVAGEVGAHDAQAVDADVGRGGRGGGVGGGPGRVAGRVTGGHECPSRGFDGGGRRGGAAQQTTAPRRRTRTG